MRFMDVNNKRFALEEKVMLKDRYRIEKLLGSNGLSITYEAFDTFREQKIVIKELYPEAIVERDQDNKRTVSLSRYSYEADFALMKEHVIKEARLMVQLFPLKNIANIITFFEENRTVYVVAEYVEGISLPDHMKKIHMPRVMVKDAFKLLKPIFISLESVHKKGVVHGRIHPSLIRVTKEGEAFLTGFCDPMEDAALEILGNAEARVPGYTPVEQYMDEGGIGPEADIYSVAAILYEMVTGHKVPAFYERLSEENPEGRDILMPPAYYNGRIMDYQSKALEKALSIYHFDRYHSFSEFAQAVSEEEFEGTIRIREKPVKFVERLKYHRTILWGTVACLLFLAIFLAPKGIRYLGALNAKQFYEKLEAAEVYEQCRMIAGLSEKKRNDIANDYVQMEEEGRHTILYYDKITGKLVSREKMNMDADLVRYITLDYRINDRAVLTVVEDGSRRELTVVLRPNDAGEYSVTEKVSGTGEGDGSRSYLAGPQKEQE